MRTLYNNHLIGKTFHSLLCKQILPRDKFGVAWFKWECECGKLINARASDVVRGKKKSCNCRRYRTGKENPNWNGYEGITGNLWNQIKRGIKRKSRTLQFDITIQNVWELYQKQDGICALSGIKLSLPLHHRDRNYTASLDRIDSTKGYITGNIQWVHKDVNLMKQNLHQDTFFAWCKKITEHQVIKNS